MRNLMVPGILAALAATASAKPNGPPPELMATLAVSPGSALQPVRDLADAVKPGAAAMLTDATLKAMMMNAAQASSLDGLDTTGWTYILVVDGGDAAVLGKVTDEKRLTSGAGHATVLVRDHWAVVGQKKVVDEVGAYALDVLAKGPAPKALLATIYAPNVLARYKSKIVGAKAAMAASSPGAGEFMSAYVDGFVSLAADTSRVYIGIDTANGAATIDVALEPVPGSRLAKFVGVQKPSTFALLDKLPPTQASMIFAGHLDTGPYRDGMLEMMIKMYTGGVGADMTTAVSTVMKAATGELAMTADIQPNGGGFSVTQVFGLSDPKSAEAAVVHLLDLFKTPKKFEVMGTGTTFTSVPNSPVHDGVTVRGYEATYDFSKLPPDQQKRMSAFLPAKVSARAALFDGLGAFVMAPKADSETNLVIDTVRGKGSHFTPSQAVGQLLGAARGRKDSLALVMDFGKLLATFGRPMPPGTSAPGVIAMGFADARFHVRLATTFAAIKTLLH